MNRIHVLTIAILLFFVVTTASAQNRHFGLPLPVTIDGKYGLMDANCRIVIPAQYIKAFDFSEGLPQ